MVNPKELKNGDEFKVVDQVWHVSTVEDVRRIHAFIVKGKGEGHCFSEKDPVWSYAELVKPELLGAFYLDDVRFLVECEGYYTLTSPVGLVYGTCVPRALPSQLLQFAKNIVRKLTEAGVE